MGAESGAGPDAGLRAVRRGARSEEYRLAHEAALAALVALQPTEVPDAAEAPRWADPARQVRAFRPGSWVGRL